MDNPDPTQFITILAHKAALVDQQAEFDKITKANADSLAAKDAEIATMQEKSASSDSKDAEIAALTARIAELTAIPETPDILTQLNAAFKSALPPEVQAQFAMPYAIVRVLVQAGETELARSVIAGIEVPESLAAAKQGLIDLLSV